jgi:hypothetical protein
VSTSVSIGTEGLTGLAERIRAVVVETPADQEKTVEAAAELLAIEARRRASFSEKTQAAIKVVPGEAVDNIVSAAVEADGILPTLFEKGSPSHGTKFWNHPVYGNREAWVSQETHPYLKPALLAMAEALAERMGLGVDEFLAERLDGEFVGGEQ